MVLNDDSLRVLPIVGMSGAQNIRDVLYLKGVDAGITSSQMLRYFASTGELGAALDQRLTYITRMFQEEMHVVAGPGIKTLKDLNGKKVNFSDPDSSTQITARDVLGLLSIAVVEVNLSQADAIAKVKTGEIAATVVFSGKPTGALFRISGGFVIARNTAFTLKGKPVDVKKIGCELGVRYVIEGSVRRTDDLLGLNVQLTDAESGAHLWADRFDSDLATLSQAQSEITGRLANLLHLVTGESLLSARFCHHAARLLAARFAHSASRQSRPFWITLRSLVSGP